MKILGIDPGIERIGYGVIEKRPQGESFLAAGLIKTPSGLPHPARLRMLAIKLAELIKAHKPERAAVESLFFAKNVKTAFEVAEARGVILLVCEEAGLILEEYTPLQVKVALTGYGRAEKKQVAFMIKKILRLPAGLSQDDALDALALCLTSSVQYRQKKDSTLP